MQTLINLKTLYRSLWCRILPALLLLMQATTAWSQSREPGEPGGDPTGPPVGGGAPLDEHGMIWIILIICYSLYRYYRYRIQRRQSSLHQQ